MSRDAAIRALAGVLDTLWDTADHLLADGTDNGWPVVSDAILQVLDANPEAKAALAAYLVPHATDESMTALLGATYESGVGMGKRLAPDTAPSELRAALERAVRLLESIDAPVARGHDARVTSETWLDAIRPEIRRLRGDLAALRGQPETPGGTAE